MARRGPAARSSSAGSAAGPRAHGARVRRPPAVSRGGEERELPVGGWDPLEGKGMEGLLPGGEKRPITGCFVHVWRPGGGVF